MLEKIFLKNYRSFGGGGVHVDGLGKVNIFIGKNNCGKTNLLRFLDFLDKNLPLGNASPSKHALDIDDYLNSDTKNQVELVINNNIPDTLAGDLETMGIVNLERKFIFSAMNGERTSISTNNTFNKGTVIEEAVRKYVTNTLHGPSGGPFEDRLRDLDIGVIQNIFPNIPRVIFLEEYRKLSNDRGLRAQLNSIINYNHLSRAKNKKKKEDLLQFISDILGESAEINIPSLEEEIELIMNNDKHLPLTHFGTGIQDVLLLGMYLTANDDMIICIDEPELHLHPGIQKSLLKFISEKTNNQYFISTHSNAFLDFKIKDKKVFRVCLDRHGNTNIDLCENISSTHNILDDLGIGASDIMQSNGIIWVEGPSDRVYIKKWLEILAPDLINDFHYSFQFYGGTILSHYAVSENYFSDYINLLMINRNSYIVMDSDMDREFITEDLRETKQRVINECNQNGLGYWVTSGREIENYLSNNLLENCFNEQVSRDKFLKIESYCSHFNSKKKIDFAKVVSNAMTVDEFDDNYDLKIKMDELIQKIKDWNNIE
ncbi:MAG: AAA family ATPase [Patescibacteria group bacterium]|nr:AAA family ATPase [Patescibacteria group bacterium]